MSSLSFIPLLLVGIRLSASAHEGATQPPSAGSPDPAEVQRISGLYNQTVKPIFEAKCFDCHGNRTIFPWYYSLPGVRQWINHDIEEAREHLDISNGFPFKGHADLKKNLEAIDEEVKEGDMPPWSYRLMHPKTRLNDDDQKTITAWTTEARRSLIK